MNVEKKMGDRIVVQYEPEYDEGRETKTFEGMVALIFNSSELDMVTVSEPQCAGNSAMMYTLTDAEGLQYNVLSCDTDDFFNGKPIVLYGYADVVSYPHFPI